MLGSIIGAKHCVKYGDRYGICFEIGCKTLNYRILKKSDRNCGLNDKKYRISGGFVLCMVEEYR